MSIARPMRAVLTLVTVLGGITALSARQPAQTFSLAGATVLFGEYNKLYVVTPRGTQGLLPPSTERYNLGYFVTPGLSTDGKSVAWGFATRWTGRRARFTLGLYSVQHKKWQTHGDFDRIKAVALSPDGTRVAMTAALEEGQSALLLVDVNSGRVTEGPRQRGMWGTLSWAPDGDRLVAEVDRLGDTPSIAMIALKADTVRTLTKGYGAQWSPDGQWIAYYPNEHECALVRPDGTDTRTVTTAGAGQEFVVDGPVWSPDSRQLLLNVSKDDRALLDVLLLDLATGKTTTKSSTGLPVYGWASAPK